MSVLLDVAGLEVRLPRLHPVRGIDFTLGAGETHCLVGESGCGKSLSALALIGLLPRAAQRTARHVRFAGQDLVRLSERALARLRGDRVAMIFQEPMTSLNPAYTVGSQMTEVLRRHRRVGRAAAVERAVTMLDRVGVSAPSMRLGQFPHQLSGGLRQRVMIATALLCEPELLIADEPTTALDVTVQVQILRLLADLQRERGLGLLLITHDLGVVARIARRVSVMYAGEVVETASVADLFGQPQHPYTRGLIASIPIPGRVAPGGHLGSIPGIVPQLAPGFAGCAFRDRCAHAIPSCAATVPTQNAGDDHRYRCRLEPGWTKL